MEEEEQKNTPVCCTDPRTGLPAHNRVDLIRDALHYWTPVCGATERDMGDGKTFMTMVPDYCCFNCPTLIKDILAKHSV